jgi:AcrR family transcriptional regulator
MQGVRERAVAAPLVVPNRLRRRARRSHEERSTETRGRILEAVVQCIAELGFQRATATEIARRAGVTWGAVQHHFGGKNGILSAVLEDTFNRFSSRFDDIPIDETSLAERVSLFVDRAWDHFGSPHFRSTFEILLNHLPTDEGEESVQSQMASAVDVLWIRLFSDAPLPRSRRLLIQRYAIAVLSGLAYSVILRGKNPGAPAGELRLLEQSILRELSASTHPKRNRAVAPYRRG